MIFCFFILIQSLSIAGQADIIVIGDAFKNELLGKKMEMFTVKNDISDFENVAWSRCKENNLRLTPDSVHYLHCRIKNTSSNDKNLLLFLHNVQIDQARLWIFVDDTLLYASPLTGCTMPGENRATQDRTLSLPVFLKSNITHDMYVSVYRKEFGITVSPQLVEPISGIDFRWTDYIFLSVIGFNILLLVISLFLKILCHARKIELKELDWFMVYSAIGCLYIIAASGYGSLFLWGSWPWFEVNAAIFFGALSNFGFLYFCKYTLGIHLQYPKLSLFFDIVAILYLASSILGFGMYHGYYIKGVPAALLGFFYLGTLICILIVIYLAFKKVIVKKKSIFIWFLSIFIFYIAFVVVVFALELGYIRYNFKLHAYLLMFCFFPQMILTLAYLVQHFIKLIENKTTKYQEMKSDIAGEIHDRIGKNLARISLSSYVLSNNNNDDQHVLKSKLEAIRNDAIHANDQLRELLVAIQAKTEKFDRLQVNVRDIGMKAFESLGTDFEISIPSYTINPDMDKAIKGHFLLIFNELISKIKLLPSLKKTKISFGLVDKDGYLLEIEIGHDKTINTDDFQAIRTRCQKISAEITINNSTMTSTTFNIRGKLSLSLE